MAEKGAELSLIRTKKDLRKKWSRPHLPQWDIAVTCPGKNVEQVLLPDWDLLICGQYNSILSQLKVNSAMKLMD